MTEPKSNVWFEAVEGAEPALATGVVLDRRTRMMHDAYHVFINGESYRASGRDAALMRRLADQRGLDAKDWVRASPGARETLLAWCLHGWLHGC